MSHKIWIVLIIASLFAAAIPVSNAGSDNGKGYADIKPYRGLFGADSPFYGVKLFVQHFDLSLEGNVTVKLQKQQDLAWQRLSEALAVADRNDSAALKAALDAFIEDSKLSSKILDSDLLNETTFLEAWNVYNDQEDFLAAMIDNSSYSPAITDRYNQTLNTTQEIKNGRPFICCNNTTYFIPPGQMKKISQGCQGKTPPGLSQKGYLSPEPLLVNGTIVWPWDDLYNQYTNSSAKAKGTTQSFEYVSKVMKKQGNGNNGNSNAGGNGKGHK
jgi:hypothetical protein